MSKLRVYMVAKELGIDNKRLVALLHSLGMTEVRNHMSAVAPEQVERVKRHLGRQSDEPVVEERVRPRGGSGPVIIRRGKRRSASDAAAKSEPQAAPAPAAPAPVVRRKPAAAKTTETKPKVTTPAPTIPAPTVATSTATTSVGTPEAPAQQTTVVRADQAPEGKDAGSVTPLPAEKQSVEGQAPVSVATEEQPTPDAVSQVKPSAVVEPVVAKPEPGAEPAPISAETQRVAEAPPSPEVSPEPAKEEPVKEERAARPSSEQSAEAPRPSESRAAPKKATPPPPEPPPRPAPPKTGIDVWEGRPGVPMPQPARSNITPRRVQYDAKAGGGGNRRGPMMGSRRGPGPRRGIGSMRGRSGSAGASVTQERSAHKKVVKIEETIALQALAGKIGVKAGQLLMKLMSLGVTGININSTLDSDTAKIVAGEFGWTVEDVAVTEDEAIALAQGEVSEDEENRLPRPPVVSVMGHVDHGKTSLLDRIRKSSVASGEAGGITQHIGAYSVKTNKGRITFLDTPGHAAFTAMRARGARCTDVVVLVVAADDGVMPQTKEAINHAREAKCPIVVAVNKIDKPDSQPERVRRELSDVGLVPEEWGGDTLFCEVSAMTGDGIDELLEAILLQAEILDLRANPRRPAAGTVIEAKLDRGRGPVATILVTEGTLRKGEGLLVGAAWGRVRAMLDENGRNLGEAGPSTPVAVIGLNEVPAAGDTANAVQDPKKAQEIADTRRSKERRSQMSTKAKVSLEELAIKMNQPDQEELKVIVKADVHGSVEAVTAALENLSTEQVQVNVVHSGVGAITEGDVNLAVAAGALIIGFNTRPAGKASSLAQKEGIEIRQYSVIYDVTDDVKATMEGLLTPELVEEQIGEAEVRKVFKVSKAGVVAGCMVTNGVVRRNALVRLRRDSDVIWEGKLDSLKRFKDDVREVREGFDCGISFQGYNDLKEGDVINVFEVKEVRPTLS